MRYIKTISGVVIYFLLSCLALFPVLAIRTNIESSHYVVAVTIWAIGAFIFFVPALSIIIRKAWFYTGKGEPVELKRLKRILLEVNDFNAPVSAYINGQKLYVTWRHQEQAWLELLEKTKVKKLYELWIVFDNSTKTVTMTDKYRSADWTLSPIKLTTGWFALSKPYFKVSVGTSWGVENYVDSEPEDYNFTPNEIKSPILNTIIKNGWNVRFSLF